MRREFLKLLGTTALALSMGLTALHATPSDWPKEINFGVIPVAGTSSLEKAFEPLTQHLEKSLGIKVNLKMSSDYAGVITGMSHKHIDVAYLGPKSYVEAALRANAEAIAIETDKDGLAGYRGYILTKGDSKLKTVEDIKGKTWAFTDPQSTSGTLVPTVMFSKKGIDPEKYFSKVIYSGSHEASILSVKSGKVDAASTNDLDFNRGLGLHWEKSDFNIIWTSDLIPGSPMAVRKDIPESLKKALQDAFLSFVPAADSALKIKGYIKGDDSVYNGVRDLIEVKKKLAAKK